MADFLEQGSIIKLNLDPTKGHEQAGYRPVLVVSSNDFNKMCGGMVKVVPITTNTKDFPLHVSLPDGLAIHGKVELDHERTIDIMARDYNVFDKVPDDFLAKIIYMINLTY